MKTNLPISVLEFPVRWIWNSILVTMALLISSAAMSQTVVDVIVNSPDHTILETAVIAAELDDDLSGASPFTVFAPTDDAFNALPDGVLDALLADPTGALAQVLLYHVLGASVASGDLTTGQFATTINGDSIVVTIDGSSVYINNAMVTVADITTDNGIVHVIDAVITPGSTVYEVVAGSENHNTLEAAIVAASLQGTLSGSGPFTVFAPTDAAFEALPEGLVTSLLADPKGELTQILLYHVVGGKVMSTDLSDGMTATTLEGTDITVTISGSDVFINNALVIAADIETDNGVVHVIDAVVTPSTGIREMSIDKSTVSIYPNPASEFINIRYELTEESEVRLEMYDMLGQRVKIMDKGYVYKGSHTVEFPVNDLESGMYLLIINTGNSQIANKVRVIE